jgi:outer membrane protein assembly factor BamB
MVRARPTALIALPLALSLAMPSHAVAASTGAAIRLGTSVGPPGTVVKVSGRRFGTLERVDIDLDDLLLARPLTRSDGSVQKNVTIPSSAAPGTHTVSATGETSGLTASASFTVRTDWPMPGFDAQSTGHNPYENVLDPSNVASLSTVWSSQLTGLTAPVLSKGDGLVFARTDAGALDALDPSTGQVVWTRSLPGDVFRGAPTVSGTTIYEGADDGGLFALDATTGGTIWNVPISMFDPLIVGGILYGTGFQGTAAVDASTGAVIWNVPDDAATGSAVANGLVYHGTLDQHLEALDQATGAVVWSRPIGSASLTGSVVAANGLVFVGSIDKRVYAKDALTGQTVWFAGTNGFVYGLAEADGVLYGSSYDEHLYAWDSASGTSLWSASLPGGSETSPAVANGVVYDASEDGFMNAYDTITSEVLWQSPAAPTFMRGGPVVADGVLYGSDANGMVYAFGLP